MPIHVQTPEGFIYTSTELPFGGVHMVLKGNQFNFLMDEDEEDIYDACERRLDDKLINNYKLPIEVKAIPCKIIKVSDEFYNAMTSVTDNPNTVYWAVNKNGKDCWLDPNEETERGEE